MKQPAKMKKLLMGRIRVGNNLCQSIYQLGWAGTGLVENNSKTTPKL